MKHGKKLTKKQKMLLDKNNFNYEQYLLERDLSDGIMFVDRLKTHRLYWDRSENKFHRLGV